MNTDIIDFLKAITSKLENIDTVGKPVLQQWEVLLEQFEQQKSTSLDKKLFLQILQQQMGEVSDENFRKRISLLNKALKEIQAGVEVRNTKLSLTLKIDEEKFEVAKTNQSKKVIIENNQHLQVNLEHVVEPKASQTKPGILRQVLFSYAWDSNKEVLKYQREFAEMLAKGLKEKPAKFKRSDDITLFIDYNGFEEGENLKQQQEMMCKQTPYAIVCYTNRYFLSNACRAEIDHYLDEKGNNLPNRRAHIFPFDCNHSDMDDRFQESLSASLPENFNYENFLDFFERGTIAQKTQVIAKLVNTIYEWFEKPPTPSNDSKLNSTHDVLVKAGSSSLTIEENSQSLHANRQPNQVSGSVDIVDYMVNWANQRDGQAERIFYLLGDFGAGKSTSCQMLTQTLMKQYNDNANNTLPIYLDLKKLLQAFNNDEIAKAPIAILLETMLRHTGITHTKVNGEDIVKYILEKPCLLIFDGFDEIGQKLDKQQQSALLTSLLNIFPNEVYQSDLLRLAGKQQANQNVIQSRILISCRTHFFRDNAEQQAFVQMQYRHEISQTIENIKNYQLFYLLPFSKQQIENYLVKWLGTDRGVQAVKFIETVHDLSGLSERPIMLSMIRNLLPELEKEREHNQHINASTLYRTLFDQVGYRDTGKHIIPLDEKRLLLGQFALYMWQEKISSIDVEELDNWVISNADKYPKFNVLISTGKYDPSILLQDLHNASLLVRDVDDDYRFAHTSFFEFFIAVGIFDAVINANESFDEIFNHDKLSKEVMQFLVDWRMTNKDRIRDKFDKNWQKLQQNEGCIESRQLAFDIWYFAYLNTQDFCEIIDPNLESMELAFIDLTKHSQLLNWSQANLCNVKIENCEFERIDFSSVKLRDSYFLQNNFSQCLMNDIEFNQSNFSHNRFYLCTLAEETKNLLSNHECNFILPATGLIEQSGKLVSSFINADLLFYGNEFIKIHPTLPLLGILGTNQLSLINFESNALFYEIYHPKIRNFLFSPDGKLLIISDYASISIYKFDKLEPKLVKNLKLTSQSLYFSENSTQLAVLDEQKIHIIELNKTYKIVKTKILEDRLIGYPDLSTFNYDFENDICYFAEYEKLVYITFDNEQAQTHIIDINVNSFYQKILLNKRANQLIALIDNNILIYNLVTMKKIFEKSSEENLNNIQLVNGLLYYNGNAGVYSLNLSNNEQELLAKGITGYFECDSSINYILLRDNSYNLASVYDLNKRTKIFVSRHTYESSAVQLIPNKYNLLTTNKFALSIWDTKQHMQNFAEMYFHTNQKYIHDNSLKMIDENRYIIRQIEFAKIVNASGEVEMSIPNNFSNANSFIDEVRCDIGCNLQKAILVDHNRINIKNLKEDNSVKSWSKLIDNGLSDLVFHPTLDVFFTLSHHRELIRWAFEDEMQDYISTHEIRIEFLSDTLALSHNGSLLNISSHSTSLLLDSTNLTEIFKIQPLDTMYQGHRSKFSNCDKYILLFDSNQLQIIDINTKEVIFDLKNQMYITDVSFDNKMGLIAVGSAKNIIYLYSLIRKELIAVYHSFADYWISYKDKECIEPIQMGGEPWKFLTNVVEDESGQLRALSPETHLAWQSSYQS